MWHTDINGSKSCFPSRRKYAPKFGYFPSVSDIYLIAIFRLALMVPPIECDLGYRFASRTLPNLNPNPKTDPDPNPTSDNNVCSAKRQPNKVQDCYKYKLFSPGKGRVKKWPILQSSSKR